MSDLDTCPTCIGEGRVTGQVAMEVHRREKMAERASERRELWVWIALVVALPFVAPVIGYLLVLFPVWLLDGTTHDGLGQAVSWFATVGGSVCGLILSGVLVAARMES